jgi:hypothetical protein
MQSAIDRIIQTYGMMMKITPEEEQDARHKVASHLEGLDGDEQKLAVEGLRYLRALYLKSHNIQVEGEQAGGQDQADDDLPH